MAESTSDLLHVRLAVGRRGDARSGALGARLSKAIGGARIGTGFSVKGTGYGSSTSTSSSRSFVSDNRQRVVIKVSFSPHRLALPSGEKVYKNSLHACIFRRFLL